MPDITDAGFVPAKCSQCGGEVELPNEKKGSHFLVSGDTIVILQSWTSEVLRCKHCSTSFVPGATLQMGALSGPLQVRGHGNIVVQGSGNSVRINRG